MSCICNTFQIDSDSLVPLTIVNLTGPEFTCADGSTRARVVIQNVSKVKAQIFTDGETIAGPYFPFGEGRGAFWLYPDQRIELEFQFPTVVRALTGAPLEILDSPEYSETCRVSVIAYKFDLRGYV